MEALVYLLGVLLLYAFYLGVSFLLFVVLPWLTLRRFFRSEWAPDALKTSVAWVLSMLVLVLSGVFVWRWNQKAATQSVRTPILLTARQPGFLPFPLGRGSIERFRFNSDPLLIIEGDLAVEGRLRATFTASPGLKLRNETNQVEVSTEKGQARQAAGWARYDPGRRTVSGEFRCVLPSGRPLQVSFDPTPIGGN